MFYSIILLLPLNNYYLLLSRYAVFLILSRFLIHSKVIIMCVRIGFMNIYFSFLLNVIVASKSDILTKQYITVISITRV